MCVHVCALLSQVLFSRKLRQAAPKGNISYAQFLATWERCFPDKLHNGKEWVHIPDALIKNHISRDCVCI